MPCRIHYTADGSGSIFTSICATLRNSSENMLMHIFSLTLKYTRPLCQLWMSFVFPKTAASVEMLTFLLDLNKGYFNGDTPLLTRTQRRTHTWFHWHENKTFQLLRVPSNPIFPVDHPGTVHSLIFGPWCSKHEGKIPKFEKLRSNKTKTPQLW